jgi:hypothetical protein
MLFKSEGGLGITSLQENEDMQRSSLTKSRLQNNLFWNHEGPRIKF